MQRYACRDLVCEDHKGSDGVNGNVQKEGDDSSDGCHGTSHFFNLRIILDCVPDGCLEGSVRDTFGAGSAIRGSAPAT